MDVNSTQEIPAQLGPAYFQYAVDRLISSPKCTDTPSKVLKCIGLYAVICRLVAEEGNLTHSRLAERLRMTHPGLLKPLEYLKRLNLVALSWHKVPGTHIKVQHINVAPPIVETMKREMRRLASAEDVGSLMTYGQSLPKVWVDAVRHFLDVDEPIHTPSKRLKSLGLIPFLARFSAAGLPVTRPVLAARLGLSENTLTPLIQYLDAVDLVDIDERRIPGNFGIEHAILIPPAIIDTVRRAIRRLEKEGCDREWPNCLEYRRRADALQAELAATYGRRHD